MSASFIPPQSSHSASSLIGGRQWVAIFVLFSAIALAFLMAREEAILAPLWLLAVAAGFTLQRSHFCFASAFRDLFLFGSGRIMKGIIVGLGIATVGFAINMYNQVPFPEFGVLPPEANILPVGLSTVVGGIFFGFGMVLSGGCVSGSLYRMAEGYIGSWVAVAGIIIGLGLLSQTWNWWWNATISKETVIWIPSKLGLGYGGSVALTLTALVAIFLAILWWEARSGISTPRRLPDDKPQDTFGEQVSALGDSIFTKGWSATAGGAILGGIVVLMYLVHMPWGVTGELGRWANIAMSTLNLAPPEAAGLSDLGGCGAVAGDSSLFTHPFAVTVGLLPGALVAALFSGEFKIRFPRSPKRYVQSLGGGIIMGYGAGLAIGCTIGAFFSSIPSLSASGWLFALCLGTGAFLGVKAVKRIG